MIKSRDDDDALAAAWLDGAVDGLKGVSASRLTSFAPACLAVLLPLFANDFFSHDALKRFVQPQPSTGI